MQRKSLFHFSFVLMFALMLVSALLLFTQSANANDSQTQKQLEELKQTINNLKKQLENTKNSRDKINKTLENTEKDISDLTKKAKKIEGNLQQRQNKLDKLRDERSQLNRKRNDQKNVVAEYINAAYRQGQQGNLRLLLNQEDPTRVARNLKYYDYLTSARAAKINEYVTTIERINTIEPEIAHQATLIKQDLASLQSQKKALLSAQNQRKKMIGTLNARITTQDQKIRSLGEDRKRLETLLSQVIESIAEIKPQKSTHSFASLKGKLPWPAKGRVLRRFGSSRIANKMRWEGVLIDSDEGSPVKAVHYGRVVFSDYLRGHGLLIIVDHGAGFMTLYAHNQTLFKELGEWVESGDVIASVGNTGGQKNTALYFELRYKGKPTNPQRWLKRA